MAVFDLEEIVQRHDAVFLDTGAFGQMPVPVRRFSPPEVERYREDLREVEGALSVLKDEEYAGRFFITAYIREEVERFADGIGGDLRTFHADFKRSVPKRHRLTNGKRGGNGHSMRGFSLQEGPALARAQGDYASFLVDIARIYGAFRAVLSDLPLYALPHAVKKPSGKPSQADASVVLSMLHYAENNPGKQATAATGDLDIVRLYVRFVMERKIESSVHDRTRLFLYVPKDDRVLELSYGNAVEFIHPSPPVAPGRKG